MNETFVSVSVAFVGCVAQVSTWPRRGKSSGGPSKARYMDKKMGILFGENDRENSNRRERKERRETHRRHESTPIEKNKAREPEEVRRTTDDNL